MSFAFQLSLLKVDLIYLPIVKPDLEITNFLFKTTLVMTLKQLNHSLITFSYLFLLF